MKQNVTPGVVCKTNSQARITAIGSAVPEKRLTNPDLERMVDTSDEWIVQRTGIKERRVADDSQFTSDLAIRAVQHLIANYNQDVKDVDMIIVSTTTPDYPFPSVATQVQAAFGIERTGAFDLNATCAGFTYGLQVANALITSGTHQKVLVIGAETLTKVTDYTDRTTCILFGDGAGAMLVERDVERPSFLSMIQGTEGRGGIHLYRSGISKQMDGQPLSGNGSIVQNGREVYKWAVQVVPRSIFELLEQSELTVEDIDWFIPHSANLRMIESICERVGIPTERMLQSLVWNGNTSSATIPLAIDQAVREGKIKNGDRLLLFGFGGGLTYTGMVVEWGVEER